MAIAAAAVVVVAILIIFSIIGCALFSVALPYATFPHHLPYTPRDLHLTPNVTCT
jgi:hypothetical protein